MSEPLPVTAPEPAPPIDPAVPLWTLRWTCPRCGRTWLAASHIAGHVTAMMGARIQFCDTDAIRCGRCGAAWDAYQVGIDWQPENDAARAQVQMNPGS